VRGLSPEEQKLLLLSVGSHRTNRPYSPVEVAQRFQKAIAAGTSLKECSEAVHFDGTSMVSRFLRLLRLRPEIQHLADWGQTGSTIAFTAASELARALPEDQQVASQAVLQHGLSSSEVKQLVQMRERSGKPMAECVDDLLRLRPHIEKRYVFVGAVISERLRRHLSNLTQAQRDGLLRAALPKRYPGLRGFASRMGTERFTIVGPEALAQTLNADDEGFETAINAGLEGEINQ
jgi:hypothetical protein